MQNAICTVFKIVNYYQQPNVSAELLIAVIAVLADWLPSTKDGAPLAHWSEDDWLAAEWICYWQAAIPWLVLRLRESGTVPPAEIWARLEAVDTQSRIRTRMQLDDAIAILQAFQSAGIQALPLKGAVLAPLYYVDPALRPLGDLDIYIAEEDMDSADTIMHQLGYRFYKRTAKDSVYLIGDRDPHNAWAACNVRPVEIQHKALNEYGGIAYDMSHILWGNTEVLPYWNEFICTVPNKISLLHHVCAHATEDWFLRRGKLMQLYDLQTLTRQFDAEDWTQFLQTLTPETCRFIYPALVACQQHGDSVISDEVMRYLNQHTSSTLQAWVKNTPLSTLFEQRTGPAEWAELRIGNLLARSGREKMRVMLRLIFPPRWHFRLKDYANLVQSPLWPLAYLRLNFDRVRRFAK